MPRKSRIDAPGALHHIIVRGIESRKLFLDDQNRYKSILCQKEPYLLELVRYIHLNPLRAKLVSDIDGLGRYPFCGHGVIMGKYARKARGIDLANVAARVAELLGMKAGQVWQAGKSRARVKARSLLCYWAVREPGESMTAMARRLGISSPAVSKAVISGAEIAEQNGYHLI